MLGGFWSYFLAGCVIAGTVSHPVKAGGASGRGNTTKTKLCQLWVYNAELIVLEWLLLPWALWEVPGQSWASGRSSNLAFCLETSAEPPLSLEIQLERS